jgi:hypothetical protein
MEKDRIKQLLREALIEPVIEAEAETESKPKVKKNTKKDYSDVKHAMDKDLAPTQVGLMKKLGMSNDPDGKNRSYFGKMLHQKKNEDGSTYQFDDKQLATVRAALKIS